MLYVGIIIGFFIGMVCVKRALNKSGAGNCKMCKTCDYFLDFEKQEQEAIRVQNAIPASEDV
jgi:hypothetical protein